MMLVCHSDMQHLTKNIIGFYIIKSQNLYIYICGHDALEQYRLLHDDCENVKLGVARN